MKRLWFRGTAVFCLCVAVPAFAQKKAAPDEDEMFLVADDAPVDESKVEVPSLDFVSNALMENDFDKYYYFNRAETDLPTALSDLRDCDQLASGLSSHSASSGIMVPATLAGAAGGAIGNLIAAAIMVPAELRQKRRINMRRCMFYKGYDRFGLPKAVWEKFNFEEGTGALAPFKRRVFLVQQAKVASGPRPRAEALGR